MRKESARGAGKRQALMAYIQQYIASHGYSPSIEEIRVACRFSSGSLVVYHLQVLERAGKISYVPYIPRTVRVLTDAS